jgi:hypothetical protein
MMTITMALIGNQKGKGMWPSLPVANRIADVANLFFIGSLVVGVVSTVTIVWMTGVKETYWDKERRDSTQTIAALKTQGDELRRETAEANARAAEAQLALERLKRPRTLGPARQQFIADAVGAYAGQRYRAAVSSAADDGIAFWESLYAALEQAGWVYIPMAPGQPSVGSPPAGIPIAAAPGIEIIFDPAKEAQEAPAALALGNAIHADETVVAVNRNNMSDPNEADRDILLIRIGARVPPQ